MKTIGIALAVLIAFVGVLFASRSSMLERGIRDGGRGMVGLALRLGADKNGRAEDGTTPLMRAAAAGHAAPVQRLVKAGADVNARHASTGMTPLMIAAKNGKAEAVDALLAAGAAVDIRDNEQMTAYTHAFRENHFEIAHKVQYVAENSVPLPERTPAPPSGFVRTAPRTGKQIR